MTPLGYVLPANTRHGAAAKRMRSDMDVSVLAIWDYCWSVCARAPAGR